MALGELPLVSVSWDDRGASRGDFIDAASLIQAHRPTRVNTIGWLLCDDPVGVSVCNEFVEGIGYRGHTFIPRPLIKTVKVIKKVAKKNAKLPVPVPELRASV